MLDRGVFFVWREKFIVGFSLGSVGVHICVFLSFEFFDTTKM